uniref:RAD51 interacting motif domain-containing protein n=1 Tax=Oryzias latipes TaxID=8090 RepID=A0A3P9JRT8_ORYLA
SSEEENKDVHGSVSLQVDDQKGAEHGDCTPPSEFSMTTINPNLHPVSTFFFHGSIKNGSLGFHKCNSFAFPDPESDEDFSEPSESEDEKFTTKPEAAGWFQQLTFSILLTFVTKILKNILAASKPVKNLPTSKPTPTRSPSTKPSSSLSPAAGRVPKWNPPGTIGKSASSSHSPLVKSPSQGLRLGLSRLVRVNPKAKIKH